VRPDGLEDEALVTRANTQLEEQNPARPGELTCADVASEVGVG